MTCHFYKRLINSLFYIILDYFYSNRSIQNQFHQHSSSSSSLYIFGFSYFTNSNTSIILIGPLKKKVEKIRKKSKKIGIKKVKVDKKGGKRKNKQDKASIEITDNNARISPIWLIEPGKLLLANKRNDNNNRKIEDIKKNASNNLVLVLLINKPINKEGPIGDRLWDKGIAIAQKMLSSYYYALSTFTAFSIIMELLIEEFLIHFPLILSLILQSKYSL